MLTRSHDRKVTNLVSPNGKTSKIANAFGLPAGLSCPGATAICGKVCYAGKLEKIYSGVRNVLVRNFQELLYADYLGGVRDMTILLDEMIQDFIKDCEKRGAEKYFRIHWDGDFWSIDYARAWRNVVLANPNVQFWAYTRSFGDIDVVSILSDIPNLTLYLSVDDDNRELAGEKYPEMMWADLRKTFADHDTNRPAYKCPENRKSIPLISTKGSACMSCGICPVGRNDKDVIFSIGKK